MRGDVFAIDHMVGNQPSHTVHFNDFMFTRKRSPGQNSTRTPVIGPLKVQ